MPEGLPCLPKITDRSAGNCRHVHDDENRHDRQLVAARR